MHKNIKGYRQYNNKHEFLRTFLIQYKAVETRTERSLAMGSNQEEDLRKN